MPCTTRQSGYAPHVNSATNGGDQKPCGVAADNRPDRDVGPPQLRGPIPLHWLESAARLPGKALHAGLAVWFAAQLAGSTSIALGNIAGNRFGLDRNAKYRALGWLEGAGLIVVARKLGRAPIVTILDPLGGGHDEG